MVEVVMNVNETPLAGPVLAVADLAFGLGVAAAATVAAFGSGEGVLIVIVRRRGKNGSRILCLADRPTEIEDVNSHNNLL
jgi:hypothetical protein